MSAKDPYEILGVSRTASPDEIKRAYRKLAKQYHPDHNPADKAEAERRFKEVQAAYEVLGDPQRRTQFDRFGAGGPTPEYRNWAHAGGAPGGFNVEFGGLGDMSEIFEQFFSRGAARGARARRGGTATRARPKGGDAEMPLDLGFLEAVRGGVRPIQIADGSGAPPQRIDVRIPAGIRDGQRIRLAGRGEPGPGGAGDLYIRCRILEHPFFRRDGLDIYLDLPLTVPEAALGTRVDIPTPDGPTRLVVPPGTSSGAKLRLRGRGVRDARSQETGDLLAVVKVVVPRQPGAALRTWLEAHADDFGPDPRAGLDWGV